MIVGIFFRTQRCAVATTSSPSWCHYSQKRWDSTTINASKSNMMRLCKRMGQLDMCSRREADRCIRAGLVYVDGKKAVLGQNVPSDLKKASIRVKETKQHRYEGESNIIAVVVNKPDGFVSGQPEHGHLPAIRLLRRDHLWSDDDNVILPSSWEGFAPAGRLDLDSTGLMIFSSSGVVAKKLIHDDSKIDKEYIVNVEPAVQVTRLERLKYPNVALPKPTLDLRILRDGGSFLLGENRPLKPCPQVNWLKEGKQLQIVLREGKKHHIRRACRELLGYHVVDLERVRIGPVHLDDLPLGFWRPLSKEELNGIMS